MKPNPYRFPFFAALASLTIQTAAAADGTWTNPAGGSWIDSLNWSGGIIADGTGSLANFNTLDLAANATVTLDGDRTLRALLFGDTTPGSNWTLNTGTSGTLTLADLAGTPVISVVNGTTTIGAPIAGTAGMQKLGTGTLTLSGVNTFSGNLLVSAGTLKAGNASALGAAGDGNETVIASGATFDINGQALTNTETLRLGGTLVNTGAVQQNAINKVVLTGNATAGGTARFDIRPGTTPTLDLAGFTLTKTDSNQLSLVAATVTGGNIVVNNGTLSIEAASNVNATGTITLNSPGILGLWANTAGSLLRPVVSNNGTIQNLGSDATIDCPVTISTGTTLTLTGTNFTRENGVISGTGNLLKTGTGTFDFPNNNTYTGKTTINGGVIGARGEAVFGNAPATFTADHMTLNGGRIYTVANGSFFVGGGPSFTGNRGVTLGASGGIFDTYGHANQRSRINVSSRITGTGTLTKTGGGYLNLDSANDYSGGTIVSDGPAITDTSSFGAIQIGNYGGLGSGALTFTHTGQINALRFTNGGSLPNNITVPAGTSSITRILADAGRAATLTGLISGGASTGAKVRFDGGTITLTNTNTYQSDTLVNSGQLIVAGQLPNSYVTVAPGGALGGQGTVKDLTLQEGSTLLVGPAPLVSTLGADAISSGTGVGVIVLSPSSTPGGHTVDVLDYGTDPGGIIPDPANFNTTNYRSASFADDSANHRITLSYTSGSLTWNTTDGTWDVATSASWLENDNLFYQGDAVTFGNPAAASTVTLTGSLAPSSITLNHTNNYLISGTGSIVGGSLAKSGTGTLVMTNANSYAGGTTINGGMISLSSTATASGGNPGALGTGPVSINSGGTLKLWVSTTATTAYVNPITLNGGKLLGEDGINVISGPVTVTSSGGTVSAKWNNKNLVFANTVSGSGKLTVQRETPSGETGAAVYFTTANTYSGGTDLLSGFIRVANSDQALGTGPLTFTGSSTLATAYLGGSRSLANDMAINTGVTASFDCGFYPLTLTGNISGAGALTLASSGTLALSGNNSYAGGTNINSTGNIRVDSSGALGSIGTIAFGGGTLQHSAANTTDYSARFSTAANQAYKVDSNGQNLTWASPLTSSGGSITKTGAGTLTLTGASTFTAGLNANGGVVETGLISDTGATPIGTFSTAAASFVGIVNGTFRYTGSANVTTTRYLWIDQGTGTIDITNAAASLTFNSTGGNIIRPLTKTGAGALTVVDVINGTASVTVSAGTLTLTGANTYTGATTVNGGTLAGSGCSASALTVNSGSKLAPGNGIGTLAAQSAVFASGSTFEAEINSSTITADKLTTSGAVNLGNATLSLTDLGSAALTAGTKLTLIDYTGGSLTGTFNGLAQNASVTLGSNSFTISYTDASKVTLTASSSGYAGWASTNAGGQAPGLDFDGDGVSNGIEYFMGQTGSSFTANPGLVGGKITWPKNPSAVATYEVQTSENLIDWIPATSGVVDTGTTVEYTLPTGDPKRFARLHVIIP